MRFRTRVRRALLSRIAGGLLLGACIAGLSGLDRPAAWTAAAMPMGRPISACLLSADAQPVRRHRDVLASGLFAPARHAVYFIRSREPVACGGRRLKA
jgi:hypothetical protein